MKTIIVGLSLLLLSTNAFSKATTVSFADADTSLGWTSNKIVSIEQTNDFINLYTKSNVALSFYNNSTLQYFSYSYINSDAPGSRMRTLSLNEVEIENIIYFSQKATKECPFILRITSYGEISGYKVLECLQD